MKLLFWPPVHHANHHNNTNTDLNLYHRHGIGFNISQHMRSKKTNYLPSQQSMHYKPNWSIMHNTVTASEGSSGTTSRSSWSGIPWNKPIVSGWSRIPQNVFRTHGKLLLSPTSTVNTSDDTVSSHFLL